MGGGMSFRVIHLIDSECDIFVSRDAANRVRIRITNRDVENPSTDIEIEGDPGFIADAMATVAEVLINIDSLSGEPN
jgi:hypothetical protein